MTYGTASFQGKHWLIDYPPHIRSKFKRLFAATDQQRGNLVTISHSNNNARELAWFFERYPVLMRPEERSALDMSASAAVEIEFEAAEIRAGRLSLPPVDLHLPPRDYQRIAIDLLRTTGALLCADDLGLGKTIVGIAAAAEKHPAVIVCQQHLQRQWRSQFAKFAPGLRVHIAKVGSPYHFSADVLILTYSKLKGWQTHLSQWARTIVFDEAQELRTGEKAEKYQAAAEICAAVESRLGLTATPVYNYGGEIFNIVDLLSPGALGTRAEFIHEWCSPSSESGKMIVNDPRALGEHLRQMGVMIRRTREDVGKELPPVVKIAQEVPYDEDVLKRLKSEAVQLARTILSSTAAFAAKGQAARQLDLKLRQATGIAKAPFAADFVANLIEKGESVIVTAWHREVFSILANEFHRRRIPFFMFTGEESAKQKDESVQKFIASERPAVFGMSIRSGAGIDGLQMKTSTMVHAELDWSPQVHSQADGRLRRDGQTNSVSSIYLVADGGSDPIISGLLGVKFEQGFGITDPSIDLADVPAASTFEAQADTNRIAALARNYLERYN